ncbi:hypothetical protein, partial [Fluoribacter gormanii]|uniref:hypothetical protein n=1 Tax=Fluoribacter gormanii TaxID=464 RepID=UPI001A952A8A
VFEISGFNFLGYRFNHQGIISLSAKTIYNFLHHIAMLYEQKASEKRLDQYVAKGSICVGSVVTADRANF